MINKSEYQMLTSLEPLLIKGEYISRTVWLNGLVLDPDSSKAVFIHTENGFDWGNAEDGADQLALAILFDQTKNKKLSMLLHHAFKNDFMINLPQSNFEKTIKIGEWFYDNISNYYIF